MKTSELFKDGTHKHGGIIYATNTHDDHGIYAGRVHVGVVARSNKYVIEKYGVEQTYLVNDWTQETWIDGKPNTAKVSYTKTRKAAMAILEAARLKLEEK